MLDVSSQQPVVILESPTLSPEYIAQEELIESDLSFYDTMTAGLCSGSSSSAAPSSCNSNSKKDS